MMFLKIYRKNDLTNMLAATLLFAVAAFSVNFLVAFVFDCSVSPIFMSEEKKSDGEKECEKESETKFENFYTAVYGTLVPLFTTKDKRLLSSKKSGLYESYYSKIVAPPPKI
jgi:hypothetical protein